MKTNFYHRIVNDEIRDRLADVSRTTRDLWHELVGQQRSEHPVYAVSVFCHNCNYRGRQDIPKGTTRPQNATCPRCGCATLNAH